MYVIISFSCAEHIETLRSCEIDIKLQLPFRCRRRNVEDVLKYLSDNWLTFCDHYKIESIPIESDIGRTEKKKQTKGTESKIEFNYTLGKLHSHSSKRRKTNDMKKKKIATETAED